MKRIDDLARDLGVRPKALLRFAHRLGIPVRGTTEYLSDEEAGKLEISGLRPVRDWAHDLELEVSELVELARVVGVDKASDVLSKEEIKTVEKAPYKSVSELASDLDVDLQKLLEKAGPDHAEDKKLELRQILKLRESVARERSVENLLAMDLKAPVEEVETAAEALGIDLSSGEIDEEARHKLVLELKGWARTPRDEESGGPCVAVFGAGIAGLTAAHELAERGFDVTVYEPTRDDRGEVTSHLVNGKTGIAPKVKLGGLAASQYPNEDKKIRPYRHTNVGEKSEKSKQPESSSFRDGQVFPGEHGFRFFPAYYMHIWDMMQRIPVYEPRLVPEEECNKEEGKEEEGKEEEGKEEEGKEEEGKEDVRHAKEEGDNAADHKHCIKWVPTSRTVYDNVSRVITQATTTTDGRPTLIFPREAPRTFAEMVGAAAQVRDLGFSHQDVKTFMSRLSRFLVTSPLRRSLELENVSAYDFFVGRDQTTGYNSYQYSATFDKQLRDLPKVLAAFDCEWGDARTNIDTYLQLQLRMDRRDNKADGVLNGPTTTSWFDHWYHHLRRMGVSFERARLKAFDLDGDKIIATIAELGDDEKDGAEGSKKELRDLDYIVVATDAFTAETATKNLREHDIAGTVLELKGFTTSKPPKMAPRKEIGPEVVTELGHLRGKSLKQLRKLARKRGLADIKQKTRFELIDELRTRRPKTRASGTALREIGCKKWDRFQTLAGIQFYFDTEFQLARGHIYYSGSPWALSSINQAGLWELQPNMAQDGYASILSVDIGDWNTPSPNLESKQHPHGKAAWECTVDEIATEVWRQIGLSLSNDRDRRMVQSFPEPVSYALDHFLDIKGDKVTDNRAPYLVPIVSDWTNRPGGYPWNPHQTSVAYVREEKERKVHRRRGVWMADHGGYEVHKDQLVFAGTWTKTFTRMTTMEAACESGRHAVNAILDHWIYQHLEERGDHDPRATETVGLDWRWPFGFVDQDGSTPLRQPTPAGDYCFIFDIENREPADFRPTRVVDERFADRGLPHPWEAQGLDTVSAAMGQGSVPIDPSMPLDPFSPAYLRWSLQHLKNWRVLLEALNKITDPEDGEAIDLQDPLGAKYVDTAPPGWVAIAPTTPSGSSGLNDYE